LVKLSDKFSRDLDSAIKKANAKGGGRVARRFRVLGLEARQGLHLQLTDPLTLTRGLTQREAELYPEWIDNDRR